MKKSDTHAFVNQLLVCTLVTICFGGSIGLGTVWMRHQISALANANRRLDAQTADIERHITELATAIEGEETSDVLNRRNTEWHLGLQRPADAQMVSVAEDPVMRLAARRNAEFLNSDRIAPVVSIRLAAKN